MWHDCCNAVTRSYTQCVAEMWLRVRNNPKVCLDTTTDHLCATSQPLVRWQGEILIMTFALGGREGFTN